MKYWLLAFLKQELKYKAKTKKEFYKITSLIAAVGDRVDSQNGHQESVILSIFACGIYTRRLKPEPLQELETREQAN